IAIVGKNGAGKTTFTRIVTGLETYDGSLELGHNVEIGYFAQNQAEELDPNKTVFETIDEEAVGDMRTKVRSLLGSFLFSGESVDKKVKVLSGGEKGRLALCKLLLKPYNLLILDEPTNHLDIRSKEILKQALKEYDGTMLIVSHDRDFLNGLTDSIYEVTPTGFKEHLGSIYDFLKSKNVDSLAQFEFKEKAKEAKSEEGKKKNDYLERKERAREERKLKNKVAKCEKEIAKLEIRIKELDAEVANLDYSDQDHSSKVLAEYAEVKQKLENEMFEWEQAENQLALMKFED
ncbi:MAG: ABC-F family ATP-binding cassette domain-containing protein, partial [Flavobacteriales bacterium]|nr:ABC-F family ATP-binding cassette domain-containing protein [Flavobacteriales bacterium]